MFNLLRNLLSRSPKRPIGLIFYQDATHSPDADGCTLKVHQGSQLIGTIHCIYTGAAGLKWLAKGLHGQTGDAKTRREAADDCRLWAAGLAPSYVKYGTGQPHSKYYSGAVPSAVFAG